MAIVFDKVFRNKGGGSNTVDIRVWAEDDGEHIHWYARAVGGTTYGYDAQVQIGSNITPVPKRRRWYTEEDIQKWDVETHSYYTDKGFVWHVETIIENVVTPIYANAVKTIGSEKIFLELIVDDTTSNKIEAADAVSSGQTMRKDEVHWENASAATEAIVTSRPYLSHDVSFRLSGGGKGITVVLEQGKEIPETPGEQVPETVNPSIYVRIGHKINKVIRVKTKVEGVWKTVI